MRKRFKKPETVLFFVLTLLVLVCIVHFWPCLKNILWYSILGFQRPHFAFVTFHGRLANQMFQYAFLYAISKKLNVTMVIPRDQMLTSAYDIHILTPRMFGVDEDLQRCISTEQDQWDCAYDSSLMKNKINHDHKYHGYFQSWKYWEDYEKDIRKAFRFRPAIKNEAASVLKVILHKKNVEENGRTVLVGIHVRNGDYSNKNFADYGYKLATKMYLQHAMHYFKERNKSVLFIACTNDYNWTKKTLGESKDVYIVTGNTPEVDMALLTMTHHTIMTVGTFGWWIGFLTNGTTIYYKHPYVEGSRFSEQFNGDLLEHFYPGWIGMD